MRVIDYQLMVETWVRSQNPTDEEILAVVSFLEYLKGIETKGE